MNPFNNEVFEVNQFKSRDLDVEREEFLQGKKFTTDDVIEWFASNSNESLIDRLYYVYGFEQINSVIGWSKEPTYGNTGGFLTQSFYTKLYDKLDVKGQAELFAYMPGEVQTDEMLITYLENTPERGSGSINNFHGKKLKTSTLEWLIDNRMGSIRDWKPEWWTPKLKTKAIKKEAFAMAFVPESLLTKAEIRKYLKDEGHNIKSNIHQFFRALPESFQIDPDILGLTLNIVDGGLSDITKLRSDGGEIKQQMKKEHYKAFLKYFSNAHKPVRSRYGTWRLIPDEFKDDEMLDLALSQKKVATEVFLDDVELTDEQIDKFLNSFLASGADRARIALKLKRNGKLTKENLDRLGLEYDLGIDYLDKKDVKELMDADVVNHLLDNDDKSFLAKKGNWPADVEMDNEMIAKLLEMLTWAKIKQRMPYGLTEDDFVKINFIIAEKGKDKDTAYEMLEKLADNGFIDVEDSTFEILRELGDEGSYEGWKAAKDMFMF